MDDQEKPFLDRIKDAIVYGVRGLLSRKFLSHLCVQVILAIKVLRDDASIEWGWLLVATAVGYVGSNVAQKIWANTSVGRVLSPLPAAPEKKE